MGRLVVDSGVGWNSPLKPTSCSFNWKSVRDGSFRGSRGPKPLWVQNCLSKRRWRLQLARREKEQRRWGFLNGRRRIWTSDGSGLGNVKDLNAIADDALHWVSMELIQHNKAEERRKFQRIPQLIKGCDPHEAGQTKLEVWWSQKELHYSRCAMQEGCRKTGEVNVNPGKIVEDTSTSLLEFPSTSGDSGSTRDLKYSPEGMKKKSHELSCEFIGQMVCWEGAL